MLWVPDDENPVDNGMVCEIDVKIDQVERVAAVSVAELEVLADEFALHKRVVS